MNENPQVGAVQMGVSGPQDFYLYKTIKYSIVLYFLFTRIAASALSRGIPCSVDSAEFPYITLKCKLKN